MEKFNNGLQTFSLQNTTDPDFMAAVDAIRPVDAAILPQPDTSAPVIAQLDPETAARHYLENALAFEGLPAFTVSATGGDQTEFKSLGTETLSLTDTKIVKFRQFNNKVPVYGSLVTVELDNANNLVTINSAVGSPSNVSPVATVSPVSALNKVRSLAGYELGPQAAFPARAVPRLNYYYDTTAQLWRLVYIVEDIRKSEDSHGPEPQTDPSGRGHLAAMQEAFAVDAEGTTSGERDDLEEFHIHGRPVIVDYVLDAHTNDLVAELPRVLNALAASQVLTAHDGLGRPRQIRVDTAAGVHRLQDTRLNVSTYDFQFQDIDLNSVALPGTLIQNPPQWDAGAISAHANAAEVVAFFREVLRRNSLDNMGYRLISSVNCVAIRSGSQGRTWKNAAWIGNQMVYGQQPGNNGSVRSFALGLDIVGHEITHGLIQFTARLQYVSQPGALNESYSDIFGVIIANRGEPDIGNWNWEIGRDLSANGVPLRNMQTPEQHQQPSHMNEYRAFSPPYNQRNDYGGVHINSGIHNKAAYNLLTTKDGAGNFLFTMQEVAALFYIALTQHLSRTSGFNDSRRAVELAGGSLFRYGPQQAEKLAAISSAFVATGIA